MSTMSTMMESIRDFVNNAAVVSDGPNSGELGLHPKLHPITNDPIWDYTGPQGGRQQYACLFVQGQTSSPDPKVAGKWHTVTLDIGDPITLEDGKPNILQVPCLGVRGDIASIIGNNTRGAAVIVAGKKLYVDRLDASTWGLQAEPKEQGYDVNNPADGFNTRQAANLERAQRRMMPSGQRSRGGAFNQGANQF